jgi:hexosaminidase
MWRFYILSFIIGSMILKQTGYSICLAILGFVMSHAVAAPQLDLLLVPMPEHIALNPGRLAIDSDFTVQLKGQRDPRLARAVDRMLQRIQAKTGVPFRIRPTADAALNVVTMQIHCSGPGETVQSVAADESYQLEVTDHGVILLAPSPTGVLRGIETFLQLIERDQQSFFLPCINIEDRPRFRWRGLHIDVSRHWEPPEVIRRNLDAMAAVKLNVFHWHLSDDQGFRIESKRFPKLHQKGSDGKYYTQAEVQEIIAYAFDRGIRVIPEFDMPGHSTSWLAAYPHLASVPRSYEIERTWGVFEPCMDPAKETTYTFLDSFIGEMASLFPDKYFHIGGDEVNEKQWKASRRIRSFKTRHRLKNNRDLQAYFNRRLSQILIKHDKTMMGWDEVLHPDLPKDVVIQVWRRQPTISDVARKGYAGVLSYGYYLDAMRPASFHYEMDPLGKEAGSLTDEEKARVLGGEACMWAEFVNSDNIDSRIWPRTAAIAERLWSPAERTDIKDMYRRLERLDQELERIGLKRHGNALELMRQMTGAQDIAALQDLSRLFVPTGLGVRQRTRKYSSLTPLNRMADIVLPESSTARQLDDSVQALLAGRPGSASIAQQIRRKLTDWRENEASVEPVLQNSSLLQEILPLSQTVAELCLKGLQALDFMEANQRAPEIWQKETADLLSRAEKPQAEMLPAITAAIRKLADAVK